MHSFDLDFLFNSMMELADAHRHEMSAG